MFGKLPFDSGEVQVKAEIVSRRLQPLQMISVQGVAVARSPSEGLQQFKRFVGNADDTGLGQALGIFGIRFRIPDDSPAGAIDGALIGTADVQGTDGDVELGSAAWTQIAHSTGIGASRARFQVPNQAHGVDFGCAGNGRAGKQCSQNVYRTGIRPCPDGGGHLMHAVIGLQAEEVRHADAARHGDPAQIIADHVHDHEVLCPVLGRVRQCALAQGVVIGSQSPGGSPLHWPAQNLLAVQPKEQFRGVRRNDPITGVHVGRIGCFVMVCQ